MLSHVTNAETSLDFDLAIPWGGHTNSQKMPLPDTSEKSINMTKTTSLRKKKQNTPQLTQIHKAEVSPGLTLG